MQGIIIKALSMSQKTQTGSEFNELVSKEDIKLILTLMQGNTSDKNNGALVQNLTDSVWDRYLAVSFERAYMLSDP